MLSTPQQTNTVWFTSGAKLDLAWFALLLTDYPGIRLIRQPTTHLVVTADSCLTGAGAATDAQFYTLEYPPHITDRALPINQLEMLNLLIATRLWIKQWQSKNILLFSDNAAVVATLQAGKAHEPFLRAAAREIWLLTARHDVGLTVRHRPGGFSNHAHGRRPVSCTFSPTFPANHTNADKKGQPADHSTILPDSRPITLPLNLMLVCCQHLAAS